MNYHPNIHYLNLLWEKEQQNFLLIKKCFVELFTLRWDLPDRVNTKLLFFQSMNRNDYSSFVSSIRNSVHIEQQKYLLIKENAEFNLDWLSLNIKEVIHMYKSLEGYVCLKKIYIFLKLVKIASIQKYVKNYNVNAVIVHADMQLIENYIINYFRENKIKTVTLQHGLYIDYTKQPNINIINYQNVSSEYFLAWGDETKKLINKYHTNCKVIICGNPVLYKKDKAVDDFFVVIFDQDIYKNYNKKILKIARLISAELNLKLFVKLHPQNLFKDYDITREEVIKHDKIYNTRFALGHTSTMLFELMNNEIPIYKYNSPIPSNYINQQFIFENYEDLLHKLYHDAEEKINLKNEAKYYIKYSGEEAANKYMCFFKELLLL